MPQRTFVIGAVLIGSVLFLSVIYTFQHNDLEARGIRMPDDESLKLKAIAPRHKTAAAIYQSLKECLQE